MSQEEKVCGAYIGFLLTALAIALLSGCQTAGYSGYARGGYAGGGMYFRGPVVPVPPSNVGFLYREPAGWEAGERGFTIFNPAVRNFRRNNRHARCWLDGMALQWVVNGWLQRGYVATANGGAIPVPLLAPGQESYHVLDPGSHHIRCEFYVGPPPFKLTAEGTATFDTRQTLEPRLSMEYINALSSSSAYAEQ